jgi:hypothetical protein
MKLLTNIFKILVVLTLITYIQLPVAWADVLTPGESPVNYCFKITNLDKYPNYLLIAHVKSQNPNLPTHNIILKPGKCLGLNGYREYRVNKNRTYAKILPNPLNSVRSVSLW